MGECSILAGCATANKQTTPQNGAAKNQSTKNVVSSQSGDVVNTTTAPPSNGGTNVGNKTTSSTSSTPRIQETSYKNASAAANAVSKIQRQNTYLAFASSNSNPLVNLGLGISAKQDGGLDHYGLQWQEGNWVVETLWFSGNQGGKQMAKNIVSYLHTHMLPAPHTHGIIIVNSTDPNSKAIKANTIIAWQEGNKLYQLKQTGNPNEVLRTVVSSNNKTTSSATNTTQNQIGQSSTSKNDSQKAVVFIKGTIESATVKQKYSILRVKVQTVYKVKSNGDKASIHSGDVVSILFNSSLSQYGPGGGGQKPILEVKPGVQMATQVTYHPQSNGAHWTSSFDGYLFKKNDVYLNWKGQSFGNNLANAQ